MHTVPRRCTNSLRGVISLGMERARKVKDDGRTKRKQERIEKNSGANDVKLEDVKLTTDIELSPLPPDKRGSPGEGGKETTSIDTKPDDVRLTTAKDPPPPNDDDDDDDEKPPSAPPADQLKVG